MKIPGRRAKAAERLPAPVGVTGSGPLTIGTRPDPDASRALIQAIVSAGLGAGIGWHGGIDRNIAMSIPALRRGRNVLCGSISAFQMRAYAGPSLLPDVPRLLTQPEATRPRSATYSWLVDDLVFYPHAWWHVTRRDWRGFPVEVERVEPWRVTWSYREGHDTPFDPHVYVDGYRVPDADLIRFDSPDEGLLTNGQTAVKTAVTLERSANHYADVDVPTMILKYVGSTPFGRELAQQVRAEWEESRREHRTAVLSANVEATQVYSSPETLQLIQARQHSALEMSRLMNLPPRYVGASAGDSMTYTNQPSERKDLADLSFRPYLMAVEERLSMDDVTPRGMSVRHELDVFLRGDVATFTEHVLSLVAGGVITTDEARFLLNLNITGAPAPVALPGETP